MELIVELGQGPREVGRARQALAGILARWGVTPDRADLAVLLTSELVTNAIRHGSPPVRLRAYVAKRLRVEVDDASYAGVRPRRVDMEALDGRGLQLIEGLAHRWGSGSMSSGKRVWFELDLTA